MSGDGTPSLDALLVEIREWANATFAHATAASKAEHLRREACELCAAPTDIEEMADIFVLLAHASDGQDLAAAVAAKLAKNRGRAWGTPDDDGVVEHVSGDGTPGPAREVARCPDCGEKCQPGTIHNCPYRGPLQVPGDSGGPREAVLRQVREIAFDWLHSEGGANGWNTISRIHTLTEAALRAELGRAGTEEREKAVREAAERFLHECHGMLHLKIFSESRRAAHDALRGALDAAPDAERPNG